MFHEFTHQILQVFAGKNDAPAWLVEGIAVYTQTATFDRGRVVIPGARPSHALSVNDLMMLKTNAAWHAYHGGGGRQSAYPDAGSLVTYGMNAEDGRFRADLIDFVRDSYFGRTRGAALWDYLGLGEKEFPARIRGVAGAVSRAIDAFRNDDRRGRGGRSRCVRVRNREGREEREVRKEEWWWSTRW